MVDIHRSRIALLLFGIYILNLYFPYGNPIAHLPDVNIMYQIHDKIYYKAVDLNYNIANLLFLDFVFDK